MYLCTFWNPCVVHWELNYDCMLTVNDISNTLRYRKIERIENGIMGTVILSHHALFCNLLAGWANVTWLVMQGLIWVGTCKLEGRYLQLFLRKKEHTLKANRFFIHSHLGLQIVLQRLKWKICMKETEMSFPFNFLFFKLLMQNIWAIHYRISTKRHKGNKLTHFLTQDWSHE